MKLLATTSLEAEHDLDALQRIDPRLVALALGRIEDGELRELIERAVDEPAVEAAVLACWTLDPQLRERLFEEVRQARQLLEQPPGPPHWVLMLMPTGLAATMIAFVVVALGTLLQAPSLPEYRLEVRGGLRTTRSVTTDQLIGRLAPSAPLELLFRPDTAVEGVATAAVFYVGPDGWTRLPTAPEISPSGSVRWRGTVDSMLPDRLGTVELVVAVQAGPTPPTAVEARRALGRRTRHLRIATTTLVIDRP